MGRPGDNVLSALRALRENGLRSALTMLGIVIGVASGVLLVGIGRGVERDISRQIAGLGANVVFVLPGKLDRSGQPNPLSMIGISTLTDADLSALAKVPGVTAAIPIMFVYGAAERGRATYSGFVIGCGARFFETRRQPLAAGRVFGPGEPDRRVCVLSDGPKRDMFGASPAVGKAISVRGIRFQVVGVLEPEEESLFGPGFLSNLVYLPYGAARRAFPQGQLNRIFLQLDYRRDPAAVLDAARAALLKTHHGRDDFGLMTARQLLGAIFQVVNIVSALLVGLTAISLVVAGIGIMNIMLVTVTERTHEIGIRKTVGARRADIFRQFLVEAVTLSLAGGVIGTILAWAVCVVVARLSPLRPIISPGIVALAFGVCFAVGIVFGVAPAARAARQDPVEALRYE